MWPATHNALLPLIRCCQRSLKNSLLQSMEKSDSSPSQGGGFGYGVGGVAAVWVSETTLRKMFRIKIYRSTENKVNPTVSKCSYSNHQFVAVLREVILASVLLIRGLALQWALSQPWLCKSFDLVPVWHKHIQTWKLAQAAPQHAPSYT